MGYELWTSQITGRRRTGTRVSEMRRLFERGISAASILEPVLSCPANAPAEEMRQHLKNREFDVAGVKNQPDSELIGFVRREDLISECVGDHLHRLEDQYLIADSTPLADTIKILAEKEFQFVLVGSVVQGIVVTADLNKPPVRIFLFGLVSLLEMHLAYWIRRAYKDDTWHVELSDNRIQAATKQLNERKSRNNDITLLSCLQFCDKRDLFLRSKEIRDKLGIESRKVADQMLKRAEGLRNHLAHSQDDLAADTSWNEIAGTVVKIEQLLKNSDEIVEKDALAARSERQELLWA